MAVLSVPDNKFSIDGIDGLQCFGMLQEAIARLKRNSEREEAGTIWVTEGLGNDAHDLVVEDATILQCLKGARYCLDLLGESLDIELSAFEEKLATTSSTTGIMAMPNEILELIFGDVCDGTGHRGPDELSQVCRRFRDIVFCIAKLWASVNSNMTELTLERHFSLSKDLPLSVSLLPVCCFTSRALRMLTDDAGSTWSSFLELTTRQSHRWGSLYIDTGDQEENIIAFLEYPGRTVKSLRSLTVRYPVDDDDSVFHAYLHGNKWKFPRITSLHTMFNIPNPNRFKSLTECTLGAPHPGEDLCIFGIIQFLRSTPALVRLSIRELGSPVLSGIIHPVEGRMKARLPKLLFFSISNTDAGGLDRSVSTEMISIMDAIIMPNVEEICMSIIYEENEDFDDLLENTLSYEFDSLKRITYSCYGDPDDHNLSICIPRMMDHFPKLESLALDTPNHHFCRCPNPLVRPRQLRSLRMRRFGNSTFKRLKQAVSSIEKANGSVAKFEVVAKVNKGITHGQLCGSPNGT